MTEARRGRAGRLEVAEMSKVIASLQKNKMYLTSLFLSITAALIIGGILMAVTGFSPLEGYGAMLTSCIWKYPGEDAHPLSDRACDDSVS